MNISILNREFKHPADGWYQIEAKGVHPNLPAGVVQVIDDEAAQSIVNRFNADANGGTLRHGNEMLIDHEHFADDPNQESRAYGWLTQLQNRADGIYGQIRWTGTGKAAVDGGDYRFFSTEYAPQDLKVVNDGKPKKVRPLRLDGLSLTNMNNNRGQKPITNREEFRSPTAADKHQQPNKGQKMKSVCTLLGLSADASEEAVHAAVAKITNRGDIMPEALVTLRAEHKTLGETNQTLLGDQCEALMDAHGIKSDDKVRNRLKPVLIGLKNREDRSAALTEFGFKPVEAPKPGSTQTKLNNRDTHPPGKDKTGDEAKQPDAATATKIHNRALQIQKDLPNTSLATAYRMSQNEMENAS